MEIQLVQNAEQLRQVRLVCEELPERAMVVGKVPVGQLVRQYPFH
jgi:hypothetical protein